MLPMSVHAVQYPTQRTMMFTFDTERASMLVERIHCKPLHYYCVLTQIGYITFSMVSEEYWTEHTGSGRTIMTSAASRVMERVQALRNWRTKLSWHSSYIVQMERRKCSQFLGAAAAERWLSPSDSSNSILQSSQGQNVSATILDSWKQRHKRKDVTGTGIDWLSCGRNTIPEQQLLYPSTPCLPSTNMEHILQQDS